MFKVIIIIVFLQNKTDLLNRMQKTRAKYLIPAICMIFSLSVSGCRTVKAPPRPSEEWTPPKWEKTAKSDDPVWREIREKTLDTSGPLTLEKLVKTALENNPATREAWQNARKQEAVIGQAASAGYPSATLSSSNMFDVKYNDRQQFMTDQFDYGPSVSGSLLLFDLGGRSAAIRSAVQSMLAANFDFNQALQDLLLNVETAYYSMYSARSALAAAADDVEDAKTVYDAAEQKFQVGLVSRLDVLQAKSNYDDALYLQEDARGALKSAKGDLAEIIGLSADTEFEVADPEGPPPTEIPKESVSRLIDDALKRRPDIAALRADLRALEADVTAARSAMWPEISLKGSAAGTWHEYFRNKTSLKYAHEYKGGLSVSWSVFDGFDNLNAKRAAERARDAARENLAQAELETSSDVWTRYYDFYTAVKKYEFSQAFLESADMSHDLAVEGYEVGLKSILDLLEAQSQLSDARSRMVQSEKDLYVSVAGLAHATGSLYTRDYDTAAGERE